MGIRYESAGPRSRASVLITRTPLRVSLGGGGTDLPSYYRRFGGFVVAAAITKYVFIGINRTFTPDYLLKYSELERAREVSEIRHPIIREALYLHPIGPSLEIVSLADVPGGTGLGSSGAFTVGLLRALHAFQRQPVSPSAVAEEACHIEIDRLGRAVGKQDQYIAAHGGLTTLELSPEGQVRVSPLRVSIQTLYQLGERLLLFSTGRTRDASTVLEAQRARSEREDPAMLGNLRSVAAIGRLIAEALESGDLDEFGSLLDEHWRRKRERAGGTSDPELDRLYDIGRVSGALGGKVVGAGGGGFLMFYTKEPAAVREAMGAAGLPEMRFGFDFDGSTVIVRD
jgi:D-glycero-alpha-D-manno-heptose-7-phosphate kinase